MRADVVLCDGAVSFGVSGHRIAMDPLAEDALHRAEDDGRNAVRTSA